MKALILDGELKSSLATVRSLGKKNVTFSVGATRKSGIALHSRYSKDVFVYTPPQKSKEAFVDDVITACERLGDKPLIYAFSDATFLALLRHRIRVEQVATLVVPDSKNAEIAFNKRSTMALAKELDIRVPVTNALDDLDDLAELSKKLTYPVVVKPQHSFEWRAGVGYRGIVRVVHTPGELMEYAARIMTETQEVPLIQNFIKGPEYGVELLCDQGEVLVHTIHKRLRSLDPAGGASVLKKTVGLDALTREMLGSAKKFARELKWRGVMMVEFKVNAASEKVYLMEINGRFWGSLPLAIVAGVDYPALYYDLGSTGRIEPVKQTDDVVSRHFLGDVYHLLKVFFSREKLRAKAYPSRWRAFSDFFVEGKVHYDVLDASDLKPFFVEIYDALIR